MIYRSILSLIALIMVSCGSSKSVEQDVTLNPDQGTEPEMEQSSAELAFKNENMDAVFQNYQEVLKALANADADLASDKSENLTMAESAKLREFAKRISQTDSLQLQQELFSELTHEIGPMLYEELENGRIYKYYCPVSSGQGGGYWYAASRQVENPYAKEDGRSCGTIYEIIRPKKTKWTGADSGK